MAIDKSHSKTWVKITIWVLTVALALGFMGSGVLYACANWGYWFNTGSAGSGNEVEVDPAQLIATYEQQIALYEEQYAKTPSNEIRDTIAAMSAELGQYLYQLRNPADYPRAIQLLERSIELDEQTFGEAGRTLINAIEAETAK